MPTYSANQIVGKTLIAKKPVAIKRLPSKSAPTVYTVPVGSTVGVVYSWISRDGLVWWMYYDDKGNTYYTQHEPGRYDVGALSAQGTQSLEQIQEDQKKDDSPVGYYIEKLAKPVVMVVIGYFFLNAVLDVSTKTRKR